jgi:lysophospholipase L1-like esterase
MGHAMGSRAFLLAIAVAATSLWGGSDAQANTNSSVTVWPKMVRLYEAQDKKSAPAKGGVLFVGSSSIRMWPLKDSFPGVPSINRGIGGSRIAHVNQIADKIVFPYEPKVIVFYSGDNDIGGGAAPGQVLADFQKFVSIVENKLPSTRVVVISIKPTLLLQSSWNKIREANRLIEAFSATDPRVRYVDVATPMLDANGKPRADLLQKDGLHLNMAGYKLWTGIVSPVIKSALNEP